MNVKVENQENNTAKIVVTVPAEDFAKAVTESYNKNKGKYEVPGFRKGHAPQAMVEKAYGDGVFFEDAVNKCIDNTYADALKESGLDVVSKPRFGLETVGKGQELVYTAEVATRPEIKLGRYKGLKAGKIEAVVTDEDVEKAIAREQEKNARLVTVSDRAAAKDDTVVIDFDGSVDGVHFDGGKAEDYQLVLGSGAFIPGFEDQIIGHSTGDSFDVNVTFPEEYGAKELAGKAAVFACKLNEIKSKELPEINDEFASEISEFDTLAEYKADLKAKLQKQEEENAQIKKENAIIDKLVDKIEIDLPQLMIDTKVDNTIEDYAYQMQSNGLSLEDYMKYTGTDIQKLRDDVKEQAVKELKTSLILEAIAKKENIEVPEDVFNEEINKMAEMYKMKQEEILERLGEEGRQNIKDNLQIREAVKFLVNETKYE